MILQVDISQLMPSGLLAALTEEMVERILDDVIAGARSFWIRLASRELESSKADYIRGIQEIERSPQERSIELVGWLPNAVEKGLPSFDMRETLLKGEDFKVIPFRHATPGAQTSQAGTPMGAAYGPLHPASLSQKAGHMDQTQARALGEHIYKAAKKLKGTTKGHPLKSTKWGGRLPAGMAPKLKPDVQLPGGRVVRGHKTDIFAGMVKEQHTYRSKKQSQYFTFRTISRKVPDGWIHPGIRPRGFIREVEQHIERLLPAAVQAAFSSFEQGVV